jgi:hypothetical protein
MSTYSESQRAHNLQIGEMVRVMRIADYYEHDWPAAWNVAMDKYVGREFEVSRVTCDGIQLVGVKDCVGPSTGWYFPYFVLERVAHANLILLL